MPRLLDLYSGRWGWSRAFAERGWECVGIDLVEPPEIPKGCRFIKQNILAIPSISQLYGEEPCRECGGTGNFYGNDEDGDYLPCDHCKHGSNAVRFADFDFICASSPCEQFSVHGMKHFHPNPPYPELGIKLFNHTRSLCEASGVPYVMENVRAAQQFVGKAVNHCGPFYLWGSAVPPLFHQGIIKGYSMSRAANNLRGRKGFYKAEIASLKAEIPPELSSCVADYAGRLLEQRATA